MQYSSLNLVPPAFSAEGDSGPAPEPCRVWYVGSLPVVSLPAAVDISNDHLMRAAMLEACVGSPVVVVDMTQTTCLTAAGMNVLVAICNLLRRVNGEVRLVIGTAHTHYVLDRIGLAPLFWIYSDLTAALARETPHPVPFIQAA